MMVSALYDEAAEAQAAVEDLVENGFKREAISVVASDAAGEYTAYHGEAIDADDGMEGAIAGAMLGGLGGLVVGLAALAVPGIGPVLAAGPIASAIVGTGVGAVTGSLIGALIDLSIEERAAEYYAEGVRRGGTLVVVEVDPGQVEPAMALLERHNPIDVEERAARWREYGWVGFDPDAEPPTIEELAQDRARTGASLPEDDD